MSALPIASRSWRLRLWWRDQIGWDLVEDGWFFYVGRLFVRWQTHNPPITKGEHQMTREDLQVLRTAIGACRSAAACGEGVSGQTEAAVKDALMVLDRLEGEALDA